MPSQPLNRGARTLETPNGRIQSGQKEKMIAATYEDDDYSLLLIEFNVSFHPQKGLPSLPEPYVAGLWRSW